MALYFWEIRDYLIKSISVFDGLSLAAKEHSMSTLIYLALYFLVFLAYVTIGINI